jgi:molybdate transport system substrate-binding protein
MGLLCVVRPALADEVAVAVAANFSVPMQRLASEFERDTGHRIVASFGATGKFYAQIRHGAPFDVLLAADEETPARLVDERLGVAGTRFTYAIGQLVLWSPKSDRVDEAGAVLRQGRFEHLAVADPRLAPYGLAAQQVMQALGLCEALRDRLVTAENITQAHQFVASGNAQLGFVALAQVLRDGRIEGSAWRVPESLHRPIRQDAVLLARGASSPAAEAWLRFLRSDKAKALIRRYGYQE